MKPRQQLATTTHGMTKALRITFDEALARVPEALKAERFGILTEIDVQQTLKQKLNVDFRRYKILGACNPPLAYQALGIDLGAGIMLPCNVVVYEGDDHRAIVIAVDPTKTIAATEDPALAKLAVVVKDKLAGALSRLE